MITNVLQEKQTLLTMAVLLTLLLAGVANAQETAEVEATDTTPIEIEAQTTADGDRGATRETIEANRADMAENRAEAQATMEENRATITEQQEERRAAMEEARDERRAALSARASERITNLAANVSNRMDAAAARIQNIVTRLESRIEKLEAAGLDVTEANAALGSAQISLNAAVNNLATIDVTVQSAVSSEDPRARWVEVKAAYRNIREQLRTSHTEIKATVQALKDAARAMENNQGASTAVRNESSTNNEVRVDEDESENVETEVTSETEAQTSVE